MNDDKLHPENQLSNSPDTRAASSIWTVLGPLGTAACAGVAAYEAIHLRPGLWWGLGAVVFMLIGYFSRNKKPPLTENASARIKFPTGASISWWRAVVLIFILLFAGVSMLWLNAFFGTALLLTAILFHTYGGFGISEQIEGATRL